MTPFWMKSPSGSGSQLASQRLKLLVLSTALATAILVLVLFVAYRPAANSHFTVVRANISATYLASNPVGLANLGTTCYANSVLQMMYRMPVVWAILKAVRELNAPAQDSSSLALCRNLGKLYAGMEAAASKAAIDPSPWPFLPPGFTTSQQEDSEEFFTSWLDVLEKAAQATGFDHTSITRSLYISVIRYREPVVPVEEVVRAPRRFVFDQAALAKIKKPSSRASKQGADRENAANPELVPLVIDGSLTERAGKDLWTAIKTTIPLNYTGNQPLPLTQIFPEEPFGREIIENNAYWYRIESLPDVVPISVLRYRYNMTTGEAVKLKTALDIPEFLDLSTFCLNASEPSRYRLKMFVQHRGDTTRSGHYVSYARDGEQWREFNDRTVTDIGTKALFQQASSSTLFFYVKERN
jgi:ubiquitin C-terminal hydrolase